MSTLNHPIGHWKEWKFGLISRDVYRISEDLFEINETSSGWVSCNVDANTMNELLVGKKSLTELKFE